MRIFLDANILFSAARSAGAIRELIRRLHVAGHILVADEYVVAEARRNLLAKAPEAIGQLEAMLRTLMLAPHRPAPLPEELAVLLPEKDRPVLAAALNLRCDVLVTGDRTHFGRMYGRRFLDLAVHSPRTLAEALDL
ncbi:MAG: putative toxin-antitoxin system toxin component, PIN family [Alphaproteobacteria bacterium]